MFVRGCSRAYALILRDDCASGKVGPLMEMYEVERAPSLEDVVLTQTERTGLMTALSNGG